MKETSGCDLLQSAHTVDNTTLIGFSRFTCPTRETYTVSGRNLSWRVSPRATHEASRFVLPSALVSFRLSWCSTRSRSSSSVLAIWAGQWGECKNTPDTRQHGGFGSRSAQYSEPSVNISSPFPLHSLGRVASHDCNCTAVNYDHLESMSPGKDDSSEPQP